MDRAPPVFADEALTAIRDYGWPGNVRELENVVQRLAAIVDAPKIRRVDLPAGLRAPAALPRSDGRGGGRTLAEVEAQHIAAVLAETDGNKTRAAEILGIDRKTLRLKLRRLGLE
jgi:DNA-binding NtrC family response regulator